jgi:hypothetical protein
MGRDLTTMTPPRHKRTSRAARLQAATQWLAEYPGENLVRGYKKRFGVLDVRAVLELRMLGVDIPDARLEQARRDQQSRSKRKAHRKRKHALQADFRESDETFAFIVGYTDGGAPYGVTWEEMEAADARTETPPDPFRSPSRKPVRDVPRVNGIPVMDDDESLPF